MEELDIESNVIVDNTFMEKRQDPPGNILYFNFSDGSGYYISLFDKSKPKDIAIQLTKAATHILSRI